MAVILARLKQSTLLAVHTENTYLITVQSVVLARARSFQTLFIAPEGGKVL